MALTSAEKQKAYRDRLKRDGKVVRVVAPSSTSRTPASTPTELLDNLGRTPLQQAKDEIEYLRSDRDRWYNDCLKAEAEQKAAEWREGLALNAKIMLQKEIIALKKEIGALKSAAKGHKSR